jgi:sterol desaturase/sphingolipid hydroxylase (fatty acid hydroxylase superfamily)
VRLDTNGYYALGLPLYAAIVAAELAVARWRRRRVYALCDTIGNLSAGVGEVVLGLFLGPLLLWLYDFGYERIALVRWSDGSIVPWVLAFFLGDFCYYVYHRAGHRVAALWAIHGVHHQSEQMNVSVALRHPWLSDVYSAPFYAPLPLLGIPPQHFFVAISLISFYSLTVHTRFFNRPSFWIFVTPATHVVHHAKNPRYRGKNLGAMFSIWDKVFGTHVEVDPAEPPELGVVDGYRTHDGALAQWLGWRDLIANARRAIGLRDKIRVFLMHPGWLPPGVERIRHPHARDEREVPRSVKAYVVVQMALTVACAVWVLWFRDRHSLLVLACGAAFLLWSLASLGALLDGRSGARGSEAARVVVLAALVLLRLWSWPTPMTLAQ